MKGLLLKDFLGMRSYLLTCFAVVLALLVLINLSGAQDAQGFTVGCCALVGGMMCPASFSYDHKSGWDGFVLALPYTKKQVVLSKYLFGLLVMGACVSVGLLFNLVFYMLGLVSFGKESFTVAVSVICATVILIGIGMPMIYKFGAEKGQTIIMLVCVAGFMLLARSVMEMQKAGLSGLLGMVVLLLPIIAAATVIGSYFITCRIYETEKPEARQATPMPRQGLR